MNAVAAPAPRVERWTRVSISFTSALAGLLALLAFAPLLFGENTLDNLIQLYFLVILAIMWNALAGYGGLVSVGQQAFIGIGAYAVVFLSVQHSLNPYFAMLLAFAPLLFGENTLDNLIQLYFLVILAIMWNALAGYGGLVSVGQQAFIGIGAYAVVFLSVQHSLNPYFAMLLATLIGAGISIPLAAVMLWLRGGAFAIGMWVVAEIFAIFVSLDATLGGGTGTSAVLAFNLRYSPEQRTHYTYWAALGFAAVLLVVLFVLLRSRLGASLQAIRDDEEAARSVGVRVLLGKGVLFVLAGAGCTAAGAVILAWQLSILPLGPDSVFGVNWSAKMIFMVLVGGLGTFEGPIIGAIVLYLLQQYGPQNGVWYFTLLGGIAIGVALFLPRGLWGAVRDRFNLELLPVGYRVRS